MSPTELRIELKQYLACELGRLEWRLRSDQEAQMARIERHLQQLDRRMELLESKCANMAQTEQQQQQNVPEQQQFVQNRPVVGDQRFTVRLIPPPQAPNYSFPPPMVPSYNLSNQVVQVQRQQNGHSSTGKCDQQQQPLPQPISKEFPVQEPSSKLKPCPWASGCPANSNPSFGAPERSTGKTRFVRLDCGLGVYFHNDYDQQMPKDNNCPPIGFGADHSSGRNVAKWAPTMPKVEEQTHENGKL